MSEIKLTEEECMFDRLMLNQVMFESLRHLNWFLNPPLLESPEETAADIESRIWKRSRVAGRLPEEGSL